ncbi:MAG TPA: class I SAM-dependent methyltransferase [Stellaceae bacterium]|nr:class I SAM-dependent methyltransferase [Stellaceae bacterium]
MADMGAPPSLAADPLGVPSPWVRRFAHLVPSGGSVLDLAAGAGRHTRFFLDRGHEVVAVDRTLAGLADLGGRAGLETIEADLETETDLETPAGWPLGERRFDAIIVTNYLHRPLLPALGAALKPGGALIYETFAAGNEQYGRPSHPDYLLQPNELLDAFTGLLTIVGFEHGIVFTPRPAAIQRLAAVRDLPLTPL